MDSIYSFIKSYIPNSNRDPKEDFLTQILAWTLMNVPKFRQEYIRFLVSQINSPNFFELPEEKTIIKTQYANKNGYIDMFIRGESNGFIVEHKIDSALSTNQIDKYKVAISKEFKGTFYTVLITTTHMQHTQQADVMLIWADVYDFLLSIIDEFDSQEKFLLQQLASYLKQQGLGRMDPVNMDNILGYFPGMQLESKLDVLFGRIVGTDWKTHCQNLGTVPNSTYNPTFHNKRWGRKGIEFFSTWEPGIFAGVIMDGQDHKLEPLDKENGPDFVVILEYDFNKNDKQLMAKRNQYIGSSNFLELKRRIEADPKGFDYIDGLEKSPWRVIVLRKPLMEIFAGTESTEEQVNALRDSIFEGIELLTQG